MKNKLTLKALQQELESLKIKQNKNPIKGKTDTKSNSIGHDIKDSFIQRLYMKSSGLSLFLITGILGYIHKFPIIGKLITVLSLWYGGTSIWQILGKVRKAFVILNAIIGVYLVFKAAGFSTDNMFIGFIALGHTYFEILFNFTKRLFQWLVELFDYKLIPNIPSPSTGGGSASKIVEHWLPKNITELAPKLLSSDKTPDFFSLRELYKNGSIIDHTPWYKDWSTWLYILGGVTFIYFGYKVISDPSIITGYFNIGPSITTTGPTPLDIDSRIVPGTIVKSENIADDLVGGSDNLSGIVKMYQNTKHTFNPVNWFTTSLEVKNQMEAFTVQQSRMNTFDLNYYPFTSNNPFDSWFKI